MTESESADISDNEQRKDLKKRFDARAHAKEKSARNDTFIIIFVIITMILGLLVGDKLTSAVRWVMMSDAEQKAQAALDRAEVKQKLAEAKFEKAKAKVLDATSDLADPASEAIRDIPKYIAPLLRDFLELPQADPDPDQKQKDDTENSKPKETIDANSRKESHVGLTETTRSESEPKDMRVDVGDREFMEEFETDPMLSKGSSSKTVQSTNKTSAESSKDLSSFQKRSTSVFSSDKSSSGKDSRLEPFKSKRGFRNIESRQLPPPPPRRYPKIKV